MKEIITKIELFKFYWRGYKITCGKGPESTAVIAVYYTEMNLRGVIPWQPLTERRAALDAS